MVKLAQAGYTLSESGLRHWRQMGRITDAHGCMLFADLTGLPADKLAGFDEKATRARG